MSDIRNKCPLECRSKDKLNLWCDDEYCIRYKAYKKGRADGRAEMLDEALEDERAKVIDEIKNEVDDFLLFSEHTEEDVSWYESIVELLHDLKENK